MDLLCCAVVDHKRQGAVPNRLGGFKGAAGFCIGSGNSERFLYFLHNIVNKINNE